MLKKLYEERAALVAQARKYNDEHAADWNEERQAQYDAMMADVNKKTSEIRRLEEIEKLEAENAASEGRTVVPNPTAGTEGNAVNPADTPEYREAWNRYARYGDPQELRSMNITVDPNGGYLVPTELYGSMIRLLHEYTDMRQYATVIPTTTDKEIIIPNDDGVAYWTGEEQAYTESDETLGARTLGGHKLTRLQKVSEELVQDSGFDIAAFLSNAFAMSFANKEEEAFTTGNGVGRPTGFIVDATVGKTTAVANAIDPDEIKDLFRSVAKPYRRRGIWMMDDATIGEVSKMKDGNGAYIWRAGPESGDPDTILGRPVVANNSMATIAATAKVMAFGDFSYYWIADRGTAIVQRLNELYAGNGQIGFRMARRMDGKLTVADAVKVMQMHA